MGSPSPRWNRRRRRRPTRARDLGGVLPLGAEPVLQVDGDGQSTTAREQPHMLNDLVERHAPSRRPSMNTKPELIVASALKPSASSHVPSPVPRVRDHATARPASSAWNTGDPLLLRAHAETLPDTRARDAESAFGPTLRGGSIAPRGGALSPDTMRDRPARTSSSPRPGLGARRRCRRERGGRSATRGPRLAAVRLDHRRLQVERLGQGTGRGVERGRRPADEALRPDDSRSFR